MAVVNQDTSMLPLKLKPGDRIRVTQRIESRTGAWPSRVEGTVESCKWEPTGSWFAHGKDDRLWLLRVRLRKDDGEITTLVIDRNSEIDLLTPPPSSP